MVLELTGPDCWPLPVVELRLANWEDFFKMDFKELTTSRELVELVMDLHELAAH